MSRLVLSVSFCLEFFKSSPVAQATLQSPSPTDQALSGSPARRFLSCSHAQPDLSALIVCLILERGVGGWAPRIGLDRWRRGLGGLLRGYWRLAGMSRMTLALSPEDDGRGIEHVDVEWGEVCLGFGDGDGVDGACLIPGWAWPGG